MQAILAARLHGVAHKWLTKQPGNAASLWQGHPELHNLQYHFIVAAAAWEPTWWCPELHLYSTIDLTVQTNC